MNEQFNLFLASVDEDNREFALELNSYLTQHNCKCDIKSAKSGYVVSYILCDSKKTLATFVFRKSGIKLRIYTDNLLEYEDFLTTLPASMKKDIKKASVCKRLINPDDCNPRCPKGYEFTLDDTSYQKCRYMAFMPTLTPETNPYILQLLNKELTHRK